MRVCFGASETRLVTDDQGVTVHLAMPHLAGPSDEVLLEIADGVVETPLPGSALLAGEHWLAGAFVRPWHGPLDELSATLYRELLLLTRGWQIGRIWNYVPEINSETTGLENYRRFNLGRWQAYHDAFGDTLAGHLPAASAVGLRGDTLVSLFVAARGKIERVENPRQIPAWRYPSAYGPKAPSFVRAAQAAGGGVRWSWVSGTASIRGHESMSPGDLTGQLAVTRENLDAVLAALRLPAFGLPAPVGTDILTKVYLRHRSDLEAVLAEMAGLVPQALIVEADVCRAELRVEIEVSARNFQRSGASR